MIWVIFLHCIIFYRHDKIKKIMIINTDCETQTTSDSDDMSLVLMPLQEEQDTDSVKISQSKLLNNSERSFCLTEKDRFFFNSFRAQ